MQGFHRALYDPPIPLYDAGGRREEICGLAVEDVIADGEMPGGLQQRDAPLPTAINNKKTASLSQYAIQTY